MSNRTRLCDLLAKSNKHDLAPSETEELRHLDTAMNTNHTPPTFEQWLIQTEGRIRAEKQRDALLAALEAILESYPEIAGFGQDDFRDAINTARAVIAQATGRGGESGEQS